MEFVVEEILEKMNEDISIVICCAGMGTRLGIGTTKALVQICGQPVIKYQLDLLKDYSDVRVVVGYQADKVINTVRKYRNDVMFAFNYQYDSTGVGASLSKGMVCAQKYVVVIDGDVIVHPEDLRKILQYEGECIGGSKSNSDETFYLEINEDHSVLGFSENVTEYEWSGIAKIKSTNLKHSDGKVLDMIEPNLPIKMVEIRAKEIDTQEDYERVIEWVKGNYAEY